MGAHALELVRVGREGQARALHLKVDAETQTQLVKAQSDTKADLIRAEADDLGDLKSLKLGDAPLPDLAALGDRLTRYAGLLNGRPLRVRLVADDRLRYEPAARIVATCSAAGVSSVRLAQPGAPMPAGAGRGGAR